MGCENHQINWKVAFSELPVFSNFECENPNKICCQFASINYLMNKYSENVLLICIFPIPCFLSNFRALLRERETETFAVGLGKNVLWAPSGRKMGPLWLYGPARAARHIKVSKKCLRGLWGPLTTFKGPSKPLRVG